jgi:hypothetical protein
MQIVIDMGPKYKETLRALSSMGDRIDSAVSEGLAAGVKLASARVAKEHMSGQDLASRTGNLRRAIDGWMEGNLDGVVGIREKSAVEKYKWILGSEQKTIRPTSGKFLAIPIADGLTPAGVARFKSPRDVPDGFFFKGKSGGLFFGKRRGKTDKSKLMVFFIFKKKVTITGSGALAAGVLESVDEMTEAIGKKLEAIK